MTDILVDISGVSKDYRGLRPLRVERLTVAATDQVALLGFDAATAEVFVNLVTGATLPDRGEISVLGKNTAAIHDGDAATHRHRFDLVVRNIEDGGLQAAGCPNPVG